MILAPKSEVISYEGYYPHKAPAIIFIILFVSAALLHLNISIRLHCPFSFYLTVVTCALITAGLSLRIEMLYKPTMSRSIASNVLQLVPAIFVNLNNYFVAGFLLGNGNTDSDPFLNKIHPVIFTRLCKLTGVVSSILISVGINNIYSSNPSDVSEGYRLVRGGLYLQLSFTSAFIAFLVCLYRSPALRLLDRRDIRPLLVSLFASSVLMFGRYLFRVIEYGQGFTGYAATHEVFTYVFDVLLIFLAVALHTYCHVGRFLNGKTSMRSQALSFAQASKGEVQSESGGAVTHADVEMNLRAATQKH